MRRVVVGCRRVKTVCCKGAESSTKPHSQEDKNQLKGHSSAVSLPFSIKGHSSAVSLQPFTLHSYPNLYVALNCAYY